jgi:two-component system chemotaxis response regulator CheY
MMAKIMVVDDAAFMRVNLKNIIEKDGHTIIAEAEDGSEAIKKYKDKNPDLVTMDVTMPDVDGIEALKKIIEYDNDATIIMCSAMGQKAMVIESIEAGARDFIVKPFNEERVLKVLNKEKQF